MRKIFCLVMVCILVWGFVLASNVSAIKKAKIVNTEWFATGEGKMYDPDGNYLGAMVGGAAVMTIGDTDVVVLSAPLVMSGPGSIAGASAVVTMRDYTLTKDKLTSTDGSVLVTHPTIGTIVDYDGAIEAKITFKTATTIKGKMSYTDAGVKTQFKITGKKLGTLPAVP